MGSEINKFKENNNNKKIGKLDTKLICLKDVKIL